MLHSRPGRTGGTCAIRPSWTPGSTASSSTNARPACVAVASGPYPVVDTPDRPVADPLGRLAERDALRGAVAKLSPDHRIVVVLRYVADLTPGEIADRTGDPEGTIRSRLHYALRELRAAVDAAERLPGGRR